MNKLQDEAALNPAVQATVEVTNGKDLFIRLRPHDPLPYFRAQDFCVVLTFDAIDILVELAERNGYKRR